jgi:hypothetical protein
MGNLRRYLKKNQGSDATIKTWLSLMQKVWKIYGNFYSLPLGISINDPHLCNL